MYGVIPVEKSLAQEMLDLWRPEFPGPRLDDCPMDAYLWATSVSADPQGARVAFEVVDNPRQERRRARQEAQRKQLLLWSFRALMLAVAAAVVWGCKGSAGWDEFGQHIPQQFLPERRIVPDLCYLPINILLFWGILAVGKRVGGWLLEGLFWPGQRETLPAQLWIRRDGLELELDGQRSFRPFLAERVIRKPWRAAESEEIYDVRILLEASNGKRIVVLTDCDEGCVDELCTSLTAAWNLPIVQEIVIE